MPSSIKTINLDSAENQSSLALMRIFQDDTETYSIESLKDLAIKILKAMADLKVKATTKKKLAFFYTATYIFATINLLGVARTINFSDSIDALRKLSLVMGASLAPGFMYLGGMQELVEMAEIYFAKINNRPTEFFKEIKSSLAKTDKKNYLKATFIGILAAFTTVLDATNTKTGVDAIAGKAAGIIAGVGNGIAEGILPLFTLERLFRSILNDFKRTRLGAQYERKELDLATSRFEKFRDLMREAHQPLSLSDSLKKMNSKERLKITKLMERIQSSDHQFTIHLFGKITGKDPKLSNFQIRSMAASRILATLIISFLSAWVLSRGFSASQITSHYEKELNRYNFTLQDIEHLPMKNATNLDIKPFNPYMNALNQFSYALQGIAFLPLMKQTMLNIKGLFTFIVNPHSRKKFNVKKAAFASAIAGIGTVCYVLLGLEAKENYKILQSLLQIEYFQVPQILPDFNLLPDIALLVLVGIIYGGASSAAKKVYDSIPASTCFRKAATIDTNEKHAFHCNFFPQIQALTLEASEPKTQVSLTTLN